MREIRVLSPTAILGYGFPMASFEAGIERKPDVIAVDAGSTDPGPYYLGSGNSFTDRTAVKRDLEAMLVAGRKLQVPVIVGTAGGSGAHSHLEWCLEIIREIASEHQLSFKLAVIEAEIPKEQLLQNLERGGNYTSAAGKRTVLGRLGESNSCSGPNGGGTLHPRFGCRG